MNKITRAVSTMFLSLLLLVQPSCKPKGSATPLAEASSAQPTVTPQASYPTPQATPEPVAAATTGQWGGNGGNFTQRAQQRFAQMKTDLGLTDDQAQKAQSIIDQRHAAMQALRADQSLTRDQRMVQAQEARDQANNQIRALLTPDQQTKWDAMVQQREQEMAARRAQWQAF